MVAGDDLLMEVEDSKHGFEEEQAFVDLETKDKPCCKVELKCSVADISPEKLKKYWVTGVVRLDKLKSLMFPRSPGFDQLKLWALGITTMMLLLWVFALQSSTLGETVGPTAVKFEPPPPSNFLSYFRYLMINLRQSRWKTSLINQVYIHS